MFYCPCVVVSLEMECVALVIYARPSEAGHLLASVAGFQNLLRYNLSRIISIRFRLLPVKVGKAYESWLSDRDLGVIAFGFHCLSYTEMQSCESVIGNGLCIDEGKTVVMWISEAGFGGVDADATELDSEGVVMELEAGIVDALESGLCMLKEQTRNEKRRRKIHIAVRTLNFWRSSYSRASSSERHPVGMEVGVGFPNANSANANPAGAPDNRTHASCSWKKDTDQNGRALEDQASVVAKKARHE